MFLVLKSLNPNRLTLHQTGFLTLAQRRFPSLESDEPFRDNDCGIIFCQARQILLVKLKYQGVGQRGHSLR